jgi:hypothetical protein
MRRQIEIDIRLARQLDTARAGLIAARKTLSEPTLTDVVAYGIQQGEKALARATGEGELELFYMAKLKGKAKAVAAVEVLEKPAKGKRGGVKKK